MNDEDFEKKEDYSVDYSDDDSERAYPGSDGRGHKFHTFMKVIMVLGGILNFVTGILQLTGASYQLNGVSASLVYSYFSGLQALDVIYGISLIGLGIFCFVIFSGLSNLREGTPGKLLVYYILGGGLALIYGFITSSMLGSSTMSWGSIIGSFAWAIITHSYYSKRRDWFFN